MFTPDQVLVLINRSESLSQELDQIAHQIEQVTETALKPEEDTSYTNEQIKRLKGQLAAREAEIAAEVLAELEDGMSAKKKYGSESARKNATLIALSKDDQYEQIQGELDSLSTDRLNATIRGEQTGKRIAALMAVKDLKIAKSGLLVQLLKLAETDR